MCALGRSDTEVQQGECLGTIVGCYRRDGQTLWDYADNAALKKLRVNPSVLAPGDVVAVPPPELRQQACAIDRRHTSRIKASAEVYR
jgi:hypothetical protein